MPDVYVREMVADWLSAQKIYGGNIEEWFAREYPTMQLHDETVRRLISISEARGIRLTRPMK